MRINESLKILILANSLFVFASALLGPLYAIYVNGLDSKILSVSISWFAFLISSVFFTFLVIKFGDRIKEKEFMLVGGYAIRAAIWLMFIFINNLGMLIFLQILLGLGEALGNPAFDTIFATHLDKQMPVADYSVWKLIEKMAIAIATLVGGVVVANFGFNPLFITMSALALISALIILFQPRKLL